MGRASPYLPIVPHYAVRPTFLLLQPRSRGAFFCARPGNAKGPVSDDGAFRTFLRWRGMLSDPADFSIRHALIWFQGRPGACRAESLLPAFNCGRECVGYRHDGAWGVGFKIGLGGIPPPEA